MDTVVEMAPSRAFARSAAQTARLIAAGRLAQPRRMTAARLRFADGTTSVVFRETTIRGVEVPGPAVLVVGFQLRLIGRAQFPHAVFRRECVLHTPLFAGFAGFRSKLWLADEVTRGYHGVYQWAGADLADRYATTLSELLDVVCVPGSVRYHVVADLTRGEYLAGVLAAPDGGSWWQLAAPVQRVPA
ncbi:MAG TPA: hypothetical protein VF054_07500 [Micromonosporaceae bacterium]